MKWEGHQSSNNVEDRRSPRGDDTDIFTTVISYFALGVDAVAKGIGIDSGRETEELREQLNTAQRELDIAMLDMREAGANEAAIAVLRDQAQNLVQLQRALTDRSRGGLDGLKGPVAAAVAISATLATSGREAALATKETNAAAIAAISAVARGQAEGLSRDIYERRIFDPYLKFASSFDEDLYRRREEANKRYIDAELAKGTPEGDLNATGGMLDQMVDAAAYGAARSPEFKERWEQLRDTAEKQREAMRADGRSTDEYDQRVKDSVYHFLKAKGKTDAEIKTIFATHPDPLEAVEPFLKTEGDAQQIERDARAAGAAKESSQTEAAAAADDVFAKFKASGVALSEPAEKSCEPMHGLSVDACAPERTVGASR